MQIFSETLFKISFVFHWSSPSPPPPPPQRKAEAETDDIFSYLYEPSQFSVPYIGEHKSVECRQQKCKWYGNFWPSWLDKMGGGSVLTFGEGSHPYTVHHLWYSLLQVLP
jgi:hypothetical protein